MTIPKDYNPIMPYVVVKTAADFLSFAKNVFGATEQLIVPRADGTIMHGELRIGDAVVLFTDASDDYKPFPAGMCLLIENVDEVYIKAVEDGATILQEPDDREQGRSAGFLDRFGNQWWLMNPGTATYQQ